MAESEKPNDALAYRLFNEIGIIDQLAGAAFRKVLPAPLNQAMFGVLNHFVRLGDGKTPSQLASAFQVTRPSMTATLAKLERAGLVHIEAGDREKGGDGRTKRVRITEKGRTARAEAVKAAEAVARQLEPVLAEVDLDRLVADLARIREAMDRARD